LAQDKNFLADKDANCAKAVKNYEVIKKTRAEELLALADTIKLLNDDDALSSSRRRCQAHHFSRSKLLQNK